VLHKSTWIKVVQKVDTTMATTISFRKRSTLSCFLAMFISIALMIASTHISNAIVQSCGPCPDCIPPCGSPISDYCSPIIIDLSGGGFTLTDAPHGVRFDILGNGQPLQVAWTAPGAMNAFLVFDRNKNGVIDSGKEMFGNVTEQEASPNPNGFAALAEFDKPENGGNGDGVIDAKDAVYPSLRLWLDKNHDGISQPDELFTLPSMEVRSISLSYHESRRRDRYGNLFRYRSMINVLDQNNAKVGPVAYDVFFTGIR
jgi:hypothetical protein